MVLAQRSIVCRDNHDENAVAAQSATEASKDVTQIRVGSNVGSKENVGWCGRGSRPGIRRLAFDLREAAPAQRNHQLEIFVPDDRHAIRGRCFGGGNEPIGKIGRRRPNVFSLSFTHLYVPGHGRPLAVIDANDLNPVA